jgi:hypothetical protein
MTMQMHTCRQCGVELDTFEALDHHTARTHKDEVVLHPFRRRSLRGLHRLQALIGRRAQVASSGGTGGGSSATSVRRLSYGARSAARSCSPR